MDNYILAHTKWNCIYHIVFIPKYRRKIMYGEVRHDVREVLRKLCSYKKIEIVEGSVSADHVHLCLRIPPKMSVSSVVGYLKGKSAVMLFQKHPRFREKHSRQNFWATGYYVDTVGRNEEQIRKYIKNQSKADKLEDGYRN